MSAAPRQREAGTAVPVVVNDGAAIAQFFALEAHARSAKRTQTDPLRQYVRFLDLQYMAAFLDNLACCCTIDSEIVANVVCSAEDAIVCARDRVHERRVIAHDRARELVDLGNNGNLAAVRL